MADRTRALASPQRAVDVLEAGGHVLLVDEQTRTGLLALAADRCTADAVNFLVTEARGLVCLPLSAARCDELRLAPMVPERAGRDAVAYTVPIDFAADGSTGISAADRARTIRHAVAEWARPDDFRRPGHVFPVRIEHRAHALGDRTLDANEAAVALVRQAGLVPAAVTCAVLDADGRMAGLADLLQLAAAHRLPLVAVDDVAVPSGLGVLTPA